MENNETEKRKGKWEVKISRKGIGIILVLGALALLANKLGFLNFAEGISFWQVVLSVILICFFIDGIIRRSFGKLIFSLAFLIIVNDELLHMEAITPWPVLLAAAAITAGLYILFPGFGSRHLSLFVSGNSSRNKKKDEESRDGDTVSYETCFGSTIRYITGEVSVVDMSISFGSMEVYFNDAVLKNGSAAVHVDIAFGSIVLYVPSGWQVLTDVETALGATEEQGRSSSPEGDNVLYIDGAVSFGSLEIQYT